MFENLSELKLRTLICVLACGLVVSMTTAAVEYEALAWTNLQTEEYLAQLDRLRILYKENNSLLDKAREGVKLKEERLDALIKQVDGQRTKVERQMREASELKRRAEILLTQLKK